MGAVAISNVISFKFAAEELEPEKREVAKQSQPAEIGSLLFQTREGTRLDYVTNAREHGIRWFPELQYSVVNAFADTWACVCCRCPRFGCTRPVDCCGFAIYRISYTRAQWLWAFNFICFCAHLAMYYLCITSCNGDRFGTTVNANCTAEQMEVPIFRTRSVRAAHRRSVASRSQTGLARRTGRAARRAATSSRSSTTACPCGLTTWRRGSTG